MRSENTNSEIQSLRRVYKAAEALSAFMRTNSGAATGELVAALHKAVDKHVKDDPAREFI